MTYIPIVPVDLNDYTCEPGFPIIQARLAIMMNRLAIFSDARHQIDDETGEPICVPDNTARNNLMSELIKDMGIISLQFPFDRACYPLPSGDALLYDL